MQNIKQTHLRCFTVVAQLGSITAAAKQLHRSASAVSMTVSNLESQLGQALFEPEGKSRLTPFGRYVFEASQAQLRRYDHVLKGIAAYAENSLGRVDIATVPSFAMHYLPALLASFIQQHPQIHFSIRDGSSAQISKMLETGEIDIAIASPSAADDAQYQLLMSDVIGVVCSKQHPLAEHKGALHWRDLQSQRFIANGTCYLIQAAEFEPILQSAAMEVENTSSLLAIVAAGVGITTLPQLAVPDEREDVVFKAIDNPGLVRSLGIITSTGRTLSPAASAFVSHLQASASA